MAIRQTSECRNLTVRSDLGEGRPNQRLSQEIDFVSFRLLMQKQAECGQRRNHPEMALEGDGILVY